MQQGDGGWDALALLLSVASSVVVLAACGTYAMRRRAAAAVLLAVGAAGETLVTVASLAMQLFVLPSFYRSPGASDAAKSLLREVLVWPAAGFGLVFAIALVFVLRDAARATTGPRTEPALPADGREG